MSKISYAPGEVILADVNPSRRSIFFPIVELLIIAAVAFMLIGLLDTYLFERAYYFFGYELVTPTEITSLITPDQDRTLLPAVWARRVILVLAVWCAWRRSFRHMVFRLRSRLIVTDRRLITATGHMRSRVMEIPMAHIIDARVRRSSVEVYVMGARQPVVLNNVPQAKRFARLIHDYSS